MLKMGRMAAVSAGGYRWKKYAWVKSMGLISRGERLVVKGKGKSCAN